MAVHVYPGALVYLRPYLFLWGRGRGLVEMVMMVEMIVLQIVMVEERQSDGRYKK